MRIVRWLMWPSSRSSRLGSTLPSLRHRPAFAAGHMRRSWPQDARLFERAIAEVDADCVMVDDVCGGCLAERPLLGLRRLRRDGMGNSLQSAPHCHPTADT